MRQRKGEFTASPVQPGAALVREQAGKRLPQVADGFGLGLVFTWGPALGGVRCAEAVGQGLGFAETERRGGWGQQGLDCGGRESQRLAWKPAGRAGPHKGQAQEASLLAPPCCWGITHIL